MRAGWSKAGGQHAQEGPDGDEREWHREELVLLMKAAMANPHQWDAVAQQVAGGRTPAACMKRFLNLAVEEVVKGNDEKKPSAAVPPVPADATGGISTAETGSTTAAPSRGITSASDSSCKGVGVDHGGLSARKREQESEHQQPRRPPHLGQAVPALVLASRLASNVHPEVLMAAMSAATKAADNLARRSAAATPAATAIQRSSGGLQRCSSSSSGIGVGGVGAVAAAALKGVSWSDQDKDAEMRDVEAGGFAGSATVTAGSGQSLLSSARETGPRTVANGGQGERGAGTPPHQQVTNVSSAVPKAAWDFGSLSSVGSASVGGLELAGAARATVLSVAGLHARGLAEAEDRRTEALLADLLEAR